MSRFGSDIRDSGHVTQSPRNRALGVGRVFVIAPTLQQNTYPTHSLFSHSHFTNLVFSSPLVAVLVCVASALFVDLGVGLVIYQTKQVFIFDIHVGGSSVYVRHMFVCHVTCMLVQDNRVSDLSRIVTNFFIIVDEDRDSILPPEGMSLLSLRMH